MLNEEKGTIFGLSTLYEDFDLEAGQMFVFEFDGSSHFNIYVIGTVLSEIEYPLVAHQLQQTRPRDGPCSPLNYNTSLYVYFIVGIVYVIDLIFILLVNIVQKGGLKFVNFVKDDKPLFDEFVSSYYPLIKRIYNLFRKLHVN